VVSDREADDARTGRGASVFPALGSGSVDAATSSGLRTSITTPLGSRRNDSTCDPGGDAVTEGGGEAVAEAVAALALPPPGRARFFPMGLPEASILASETPAWSEAATDGRAPSVGGLACPPPAATFAFLAEAEEEPAGLAVRFGARAGVPGSLLRVDSAGLNLLLALR
jgi:hypothetical protein